jgi:transketolase
VTAEFATDQVPVARDARRVAAAMRRHIVRMAGNPAGAHAGGSLSVTDILAVLHVDVMTIDDRFVLSKGHAAPALYGLLAELGRLNPDELTDYAKPGSRLFGHPHPHVTGVEFPTGSLGHGLGLAIGLALGERLRGGDGRAFAVLGDGELQEGSNWEAVMYAGHRGLTNLVAVVDRNDLQITGPTEDTVGLEPLPERFAAFGWQARDIDGHDHDALREALSTPADKPVVVIARTVKGRGVPFLEGKTSSHYVTLKPALVQRALAALDREAP